MNLETLKETINGIDIYILDQILKDRYKPGDKILDAGCGKGRNLKWFYLAGFEIYGIDTSIESLNVCKDLYPLQCSNFSKFNVDKIPFSESNFDHLLCNAVLHFAKDETHFFNMLNELIRVLKPNGSLLIRTASNFGIENDVEYLQNGNYKLPDGSTRFLLTIDLLNTITLMKDIKMIEAVKTTIVHGKRSMTTLAIQKVF